MARWVSFAAQDVSYGKLYEASGFVAESTVEPDYSYAGPSTNWRRRNKQNYSKAAFRKSDALLYQEGVTERVLASMNGLERVWDCGKIKYVKTVKT